jgi:hypothetical protein
MSVPNVPLGIGPPNALVLTVYQGDSDLDLTTVTGVLLNVTRALDGSTATWECNIASSTPTCLVAMYVFERPSAPGTFSVVQGQTGVQSSAPNAVPVGALVWFTSDPERFYTVAASSPTGLTLSSPYLGPTNAMCSAVFTVDVNVQGTYNVSPQLEVVGGSVPTFSFQLNATLPWQTSYRSP